MQMLAKPSSNLLQRIGGDHRGGRAQLVKNCLRWIWGYMKIEIWRKIGLSGDWCLCTALRTRSGACYDWIGKIYSPDDDDANVLGCAELESRQLPANCTDSPWLANCELLVKARLCSHPYYRVFCCQTCFEAGQLVVWTPVHSARTNWTELNWPATSRPSYTTRVRWSRANPSHSSLSFSSSELTTWFPRLLLLLLKYLLLRFSFSVSQFLVVVSVR